MYCRSVLLKNVVLEKVPMIVQLSEGLQLFGVIDAITSHANLARPLFCPVGATEIDDDFFMEKIQIEFSDSQQKRLCEEDTYKHFADFASYLHHEGRKKFGWPIHRCIRWEGKGVALLKYFKKANLGTFCWKFLANSMYVLLC